MIHAQVEGLEKVLGSKSDNKSNLQATLTAMITNMRMLEDSRLSYTERRVVKGKKELQLMTDRNIELAKEVCIRGWNFPQAMLTTYHIFIQNLHISSRL